MCLIYVNLWKPTTIRKSVHEHTGEEPAHESIHMYKRRGDETSNPYEATKRRFIDLISCQIGRPLPVATFHFSLRASQFSLGEMEAASRWPASRQRQGRQIHSKRHNNTHDQLISVFLFLFPNNHRFWFNVFEDFASRNVQRRFLKKHRRIIFFSR